MIVAIGVGGILGALLWHSDITGFIFGAVSGWLIWKMVSMEARIKHLQEILAEPSFQTVNQPPNDAVTTEQEAGLSPELLPEAGDIKETEPGTSVEPEVVNTPLIAYQTEQASDFATKQIEEKGESQSQASGTGMDQGVDQLFHQSSKRIEALFVWFMSGNMLVRIGSIVLLFGAGFLFKYAAEHSQLSIEVRMLGVVLVACVMLGVGWYLRVSRPIYGLALQGGALGLLYLTIFASFRLYELIPATIALTLLAVISGAGVAMAVVYNARWLAILSFAGGFLAPILASTGSGSHVALFSWYAVLNIGIAALAWHKAWRSLNLLGMVATFIITALWGNQYYQQAFFDSVEPFLIGFGLMYMAVGVLFSLHRADPEQKGFGSVDGAIIFGTPVGFFLLQTPLVHHFEHGMSLSALISGLIYAAAAWLAYRKENQTLMIALLSISATLLTLSIPLEFDEAETAAAWAMEGAGVLWLGLRQKSQRAVITGLVLQGLAAGSWFLGSPLLTSASFGAPLSALLIALSGWVCAFLISKYVIDKELGWAETFPLVKGVVPGVLLFQLQLWGLMWWLGAGFTELHRHLHGHDMLLASIGWITLSAWLLDGLRVKLGWEKLYRLNDGLVFVWLVLLLMQSEYVSHPSQNWALIAWLPALLTTYWLFYCNDRRFEKTEVQSIKGSNIFHVAGFCFLLVFLNWEGHWQVMEWVSNPKQMPLWSEITPAIVTALLLMVVTTRDDWWPVAEHHKSYISVSAGIAVAVLLVWFVGISSDPVDSSMPYIPGLNPVDLVIGLAGLGIYSWWKALRKHDLVWFELKQFYIAIGAVIFIALNVDIARFIYHWFEEIGRAHV